jgi:DNA-binding transcriptional regulator GbsR (MarR family)
MRSEYPAAAAIDEAEQIRRDFAAGWGRIGAAWGVAPSTATVQGYLLAHGGPLTEAEIRGALGFSHRAVLLALADCESWGLIERAPPRRVGQRGPAARAWVPVGDHWEWFRRVAAARKGRETDPVLPLLEECRLRASSSGDQELRQRLDGLVVFVRLFDRGMDAIVQSQPADLARLFSLLGELDDETVSRLVRLLAAMPQRELAEAIDALSRMPPQTVEQALRVLRSPRLARMLSSRPSS